ncbi:MAG: hypothetical protein ACOC1M_07390 [Halanaerobium sp.]
MFSKIIIKLIIVGIAFLFLFSVNVYAQETEEPDSVLKERIQLIQASKRMSEEEKRTSVNRSGVSLYVTNFHTDETEYKLGGKFEQLLSDRNPTQSLNDISLSYVIEGIYLENESTSLAGFLSLKATLNNRMFSPYLGLGAEFMGIANYQGFVGLNLLDSNFFVETKFINEKDEWDSGDFYSVAGFKINF